MYKIILIVFLCLLSLSCGKKKETSESVNLEIENYNTEPKSLLDNVRLAINPKFKDWVLFENGTYIIFDDITEIKDVKSEAIKLMQEFGPASAGGPAGDFNVTSLNLTRGWVVSGHGYGMYTYVHPDELTSNSPDTVTIGIYGRTKRDKDGNNPRIIHINKSR